ncbi:DcaP family trimeric outer membrane transporter [Novosphingobium colocasiae]|nr:DcaP family trimeric outer membrane transporter [Novosphingobium colocasiae]
MAIVLSRWASRISKSGRKERGMNKGGKALLGALLAASALTAPQAAVAKAANSIEARLERLEAEMKGLRRDLDVSKIENEALKVRAERAETRALAAEAEAQENGKRLAVVEARPAVPPAPKPQADGFKSGATTIKLGGYVKLLAGTTRFGNGELATNALGRDFYLPQQIPTGTAPASRITEFTAKQSRFWLNFGTDVAGHAVKAYLETDFQTAPGTQGSQRTTNGYNLALRRAYLQVDRWTFGEDWSTFQFTGALPESTDYVGGAEGTVFVRQPLVRYSAPLGKGMTLHLGIENPESGTATSGSPTLIENGDDHLPDFTARLVHSGKSGELSLAGVFRQIRTETGAVSADASGYGASLGGKLFLNSARTGDVRFMLTYGRNIGRYVGLNFAPDAVYVPASNTLANVDVLAAIGAVRVPLAPRLRANLMGSYQSVSYDGSLSPADIATFNKSAWSAAANLFYSPVDSVDVGIEYRHGARKLVNGADGSTDRLEAAFKYSF